MKFKKIFFPLLTLALSVSIISCSDNNSEKNEGMESTESTKPDTVSTNKLDKTSANTPIPAGNIALDKLPVGVNEFVIKNYQGYKIINATSDPLCQGGDAIDVAITKGGSPPNLSLIFKPDGTFVQQEEDVVLSTLLKK